MQFDADAYVAALDRPTFTHGGRTYIGRPLGTDEWLRLQTRMAALDRVGENATGARAAFVRREREKAASRAIIDAIFPRPFWKVWEPRVSTLVAQLPEAAQAAALRSFCPPPAEQETTRSAATNP